MSRARSSAVLRAPIMPDTLMAVWYWVGGGGANGVQLAFRETLTPLRVLRNSTRLVPWRSISIEISSARGTGIFAIAVGGLRQRLDILLADQIARY